MPTKPTNATIVGFTASPDRMVRNPAYPVYELGLNRGSKQAIHAILTELEVMYTADDAPARGSIEAKIILDVTRKLGRLAREFKPDVSKL